MPSLLLPTAKSLPKAGMNGAGISAFYERSVLYQVNGRTEDLRFEA